MGAERERVLGAVRRALADVPRAGAEEPAFHDVTAAAGRGGHEGRGADYARTSDGDAAARVALFCERCTDYSATVTRVEAAAESIAASIAEICARHGASRLAVPAGLPDAWLPAGIEPVLDEPPLPAAALGACDGALTGCGLAIAQTGTIVLRGGGPVEGRRALTLLVDLHVCVVRADQVVGIVPEAIAALHPGAGAGADAPVTFVSGPSATSDIELSRVEGVHGPRRLEVVVAG